MSNILFTGAGTSAANPLYGSIQDTPATTGGLTAYKLIAAGTTNATSVKASAGQLYQVVAHGVVATMRYLKFYNKASAPTVGTDVPVWTVPVPSATTGDGVVIPIPTGLAFSLGIAIAITGAAADADTTAVTAGDMIVNLGYK